MLTQTVCNVNREILPSAGYGLADIAITELRQMCDVSSLVAARVLEADNDRAVRFLRNSGYDILIPETGFVALNRISEFFGVEERYVKGIAQRYSISIVKSPSDAVCVTAEQFICSFANRNNFIIEEAKYQRTKVWYLRKAPENHLFDAYPIDHYFSARAVLAIILLMKQPKMRTGSKQKICSLQDALLGSTYAIEAKTIQTKIWEDESSGGRAEEASQIKPDNQDNMSAALRSNGNIELSPDFFAAVIKTAVKEAVSECMQQFVPRQECPAVQSVHSNEPVNRARRPPVGKLLKPANWDLVCRAYDAHEISMAEAAKMTRMAYETFRAYYHGCRFFRT